MQQGIESTDQGWRVPAIGLLLCWPTKREALTNQGKWNLLTTVERICSRFDRAWGLRLMQSKPGSKPLYLETSDLHKEAQELLEEASDGKAE